MVSPSKDKRKSHWPWWLPEWLSPILLGAVLIPLSQTGPGQALENLTVDWRFLARADTDPAPDPALCVIGIGEAGMQRFGQWPWPRGVHGNLLQLLQYRRPGVIAFDLIFSETSREEGDDLLFSEGLSLYGATITGAAAEDVYQIPLMPGETERIVTFTGGDIGNTRPLPNVTGDITKLTGEDEAIIPVQAIRESSYTGFVNMNTAAEREKRSRRVGSDAVRRDYPLVVRVGEDVYPSLALQTMMQYAFALPEQVNVELGEKVTVEGDFGHYEIPVNEAGQLLINYRSPLPFRTPGPNNITYFSLLNFLEINHYRKTRGETFEWPGDAPPINDQILLIGQTALGLSDIGATPHDPETPLVFQHADVINSILKSDYLTRVRHWPIWIGWFLISSFTLISIKNRLRFMISIPVLVGSAYIIAAFLLFEYKNLQLELFWPVLGFIGVHALRTVRFYMVERRAKNQLRGIFSTFCPPEVVDIIVDSGEEPELGGEVTEITAFFSDIQAFSQFSEVLTPNRLVMLMNDYLGEMEQILKNIGGGTVDKFIGDAIVGMFGAPLELKEHAYQACATSITMQKRQVELREKWKAEGDWPEIVLKMQTRIGLNTGEATVGYMGSETRKNYTMMGDMVNLAARCESGAKSYGVFTMITEDTYKASVAHQDDIAFRYLDKIEVQGRKQPVKVYEVVDFKSLLTDEIRNCLEIYARGMAHYLNREWAEARREFEISAALEKEEPGRTKTPSSVMMKRAKMMLADPPDEDWDGVWVMTSK